MLERKQVFSLKLLKQQQEVSDQLYSAETSVKRPWKLYGKQFVDNIREDVFSFHVCLEKKDNLIFIKQTTPTLNFAMSCWQL